MRLCVLIAKKKTKIIIRIPKQASNNTNNEQRGAQAFIVLYCLCDVSKEVELRQEFFLLVAIVFFAGMEGGQRESRMGHLCVSVCAFQKRMGRAKFNSCVCIYEAHANVCCWPLIARACVWMKVNEWVCKMHTHTHSQWFMLTKEWWGGEKS